MQLELIYLWINHDSNNCFPQSGFNFSPRFDIQFDFEQNTLSIQETNLFNVYQNGNLTNLTAIIGENGTGKTTLLNYITLMSDAPLVNPEGVYADYQQEQNELQKFVAVYSAYDAHKESIEIINCTDQAISCDGAEILPCTSYHDEKIPPLHRSSYIYLSNSEYCHGATARSDKINQLTLTNSSLKATLSSFLYQMFCVPEGSRPDTVFLEMQSTLLRKFSEQQMQSFLDLMYYAHPNRTDKAFIGKQINNVSFSIYSFRGIIRPAMYPVESHFGSHVQNFYAHFSVERGKFTETADIRDRLVMNLLDELIFAYDFTLQGESLDTEAIYKQCQMFISTMQVPDTRQKNYFQNAIIEIDLLKRLIDSSTIKDNLLPRSDLASKQFVDTTVSDLWRVFEHCIESESSFFMKYIQITNFEMSSGERALLNFMSRLHLATCLDTLIPDCGFALRENILLLIDEIDLYLHPEWQRRLIDELLRQLQTDFQTHYFQIILTSHSPIVLSDIPRENSIYLRRSEDRLIQISQRHQTFGANIHTLYQDAFFFQGRPAMGQYAQTYINRLITDIRNHKLSEDKAREMISVIGEPVIQKRLLGLLSAPREKPFFSESQQRQQMIRFLRQQQVEIERQLALLEGEYQ